MALCDATKGKERVDPSGKTRSPKIDRSPDPPAIHAWLRRQLILGLMLTSTHAPKSRKIIPGGEMAEGSAATSIFSDSSFSYLTHNPTWDLIEPLLGCS